MPEGDLKNMATPGHYGPYELLRANREADRIQARKYRALAETGTNNADWLNQWAEIYERSADEYTALLNERGLQ